MVDILHDELEPFDAHVRGSAIKDAKSDVVATMDQAKPQKVIAKANWRVRSCPQRDNGSGPSQAMFQSLRSQ